MNELLALALDRLAEHYHVSSDSLRRALLLRGVTELNAITDRKQPATAADLDRALANLNLKLLELTDRLRHQTAQADDLIQQAQAAIAILERTALRLESESSVVTLSPPS